MKDLPYTMHVIYAAFLLWPSIYRKSTFCNKFQELLNYLQVKVYDKIETSMTWIITAANKHKGVRDTIVCTTYLRWEMLCTTGRYQAWFGRFKLAITLLFMVRNIKCGYLFS